MTGGAVCATEKQQRSFFLLHRQRVPIAACEPVDRCVCERQGELKFGNRSTEHGEVNRRPGCDLREDRSKKSAVGRGAVEPLENRLSNRLVAEPARVGWRNDCSSPIIELVELGPDGPGGAREPGHFDELRWRDVSLSDQQVHHDRIARRELCRPLWGREKESLRVIERVTGRRGEPAVPHEFRKKCRVDDSRATALVARAGAVVSHAVVILHAYRYRLAVGETVGRGMATTAGVVVVKPAGFVEPQEPPEIREVSIDRPPEPPLDRGSHGSSEADPAQHHLQLPVKIRRRLGPGGRGQRRRRDDDGE